MITSHRTELRLRRKKRIRTKIQGTGQRPRLTVYKGNRNIQAQIIDDERGVTLVSAASFDKGLRGSLPKGWSVDSARKVGAELARRALTKGIKKVVFDRNGFTFQRKLHVLADAAREGGLEF